MDDGNKEFNDKGERLGITKTELIHQMLSMIDSVNTYFDEKKVFSEFKNPITIKSQLNGKFYFKMEVGKIC